MLDQGEKLLGVVREEMLQQLSSDTMSPILEEVPPLGEMVQQLSSLEEDYEGGNESQ